jgi:hypothetical protein
MSLDFDKHRAVRDVKDMLDLIARFMVEFKNIS